MGKGFLRLLKSNVVRIFRDWVVDDETKVYVDVLPAKPTDEAIRKYRKERQRQAKATAEAKARGDDPAPPKPIKAPNARPVGGPVDDALLRELKNSFAFYAFEMNAAGFAFNEIYNKNRHRKHYFSAEDILETLHIPSEKLTGLIQRGANCAREREQACEPSLRDRFPIKLFEKCRVDGNWQLPLAILLERGDILRLLGRAQEIYKRQASGFRTIEHEVRRGRVPRNSTATEWVMGSKRFREDNFLGFKDKVNLALYAAINPANIYLGPELQNRDHVSIHDVFEMASLVGRLAMGQHITMPRRLALTLNAAMRELASAENEFAGKVLPELWQAMRSVDLMVRLSVDGELAKEVNRALGSGAEQVQISPRTPEGYAGWPLSSLLDLESAEAEAASFSTAVPYRLLKRAK